MNFRERLDFLVETGLIWWWLLDNVCFLLLGIAIGVFL